MLLAMLHLGTALNEDSLTEGIGKDGTSECFIYDRCIIRRTNYRYRSPIAPSTFFSRDIRSKFVSIAINSHNRRLETEREYIIYECRVSSITQSKTSNYRPEEIYLREKQNNVGETGIEPRDIRSTNDHER